MRNFNFDTEPSNEQPQAASRRKLSEYYFELAGTAEQMGDYAEAERLYAKSCDIDEQLSEETGTQEAQKDLCVTYHNLGKVTEWQDKHSDAYQWYMKVVGIAKDLAQKTDDKDTWRILGAGVSGVGRALTALGEYEDAMKWLRQAVLIYTSRIGNGRESAQAKRSLCAVYANMGRLCKETGDIQTARSSFGQSISLCEELLAEGEDHDARRILGKDWFELAVLSENEGDSLKTKQLYSKCLDIQTKLLEDAKTVEVSADVAATAYFCGVFLYNTGERQEGIRMMESTVTLLTGLTEQCGETSVYAKDLNEARRALTQMKGAL